LRTAKDRDGASHLKTNVTVDRSGVGKVQLAFCEGGEGVDNQGTFIWPPSIDSGFTDACVGSYRLNREIVKTRVLQQIHRTAKNRLAGVFASRAARRALIAVGRHGFKHWFAKHLPHDSTLAYIESNTYRIES
jgi:hypothetical protein